MLADSRTDNSTCNGPDYVHRQRCSQITTVDEAKQFYPLFGLGANVALIFSGRAVVAFSKVGPTSSAVWQSVLALLGSACAGRWQLRRRSTAHST